MIHKLQALFLSCILVAFIPMKPLVAQSTFSFETQTARTGGIQSDLALDVDLNITNEKDETLRLAWVVRSIDMPAEWSNVDYCDNAMCYTNIEIGDSNLMFDIEDGATILTKMQFYSADNDGQGEVEIEIFDIDAPENSVVLTYIGESWVTSRDEPSLKDQVKFYPNPVRSRLNIDFGDYGNHQIQIFNVLGRKVNETHVKDNNFVTINMSNIPKGIYIVSYSNEEGQRFTKSITKE